MSACKKWRKSVVDHALGQPAGAAFEAHLATCSACATALREWRARAQQMDASVREALASEPPPGLVEAVLGKVDSHRPQPVRIAGWKTAAAFACLAALVVTLYARHVRVERTRRDQQVLSAATTLAHWRSPTDGLLESPSDQWLRSVPRLDESFFELKPSMYLPEKQEANP